MSGLKAETLEIILNRLLIKYSDNREAEFAGKKLAKPYNNCSGKR
jgi:hypothetical protein